MAKKSEASAKAGPGVLLGGEHLHHTRATNPVQRRCVVIDGAPGAHTVSDQPIGITSIVTRFADALRLADSRARERSCEVHIASPLPLVGDRGPLHAIDSPAVYVVSDGDSWEVIVRNAPWAHGGCNQSFVGPNAAGAADRYGRKLFEQFRDMAIAEQARRDRIKQLTRAAANQPLHERESGR